VAIGFGSTEAESWETQGHVDLDSLFFDMLNTVNRLGSKEITTSVSQFRMQNRDFSNYMNRKSETLIQIKGTDATLTTRNPLNCNNYRGPFVIFLFTYMV
jgi:hypothetical protein